METARRSKLGAWCQLLRAPNLFTVPGDPIAGYVLAGGAFAGAGCAKLVACAGASLLLYCSGLIFNDLFDLKKDRRHRPDRPLPAGKVSPVTAVLVAAVLMGGGVVLAAPAGPDALLVAGVLAAAILLYDAATKRIPALGAVNMGLCRAMSAVLGACAAIDAPVLPFLGRASAASHIGPYTLFVFVYIAIVTLFASYETTGLRLPVFGPLSPRTVQKAVGVLIRMLLVFQAAVVATAGCVGWAVAACLLAAWCVSALLARRFYAS
ncbi:MAG: UbiA family prenyltransferase [Phycisphaerae bacterium]|nr:UbiA family prenyltransferase [Phycisphaerae bacterium]